MASLAYLLFVIVPLFLTRTDVLLLRSGQGSLLFVDWREE